MTNRVRLNFPECVREAFPQEFPAAWDATQSILETLPGGDFSALGRHSPGLLGFDWTQYLQLSLIRMVRVGAALRRAGLRDGRVLDYGSYFGNFALFAARSGFVVDAADSYAAYGGAFAKSQAILADAGVSCLDMERIGRGLEALEPECYDAVLCLGVIEHVAHTPRPVLLAIDRVLKTGGVLIVDTPNLLYLYNRQKLAAGRSVFPPIESQFDVDPPFEGHHREYTPKEVEWMLTRIGHGLIETELFNYSIYGLSELYGLDAENFQRMEADPELREVILTRSYKMPVTVARSPGGI